MEDEITVRVEAPADIMLLRPLDVLVRSLVQQFVPQRETEELLDSLGLAFDEAYTNIARHSYRSDDKGPVWVLIRISSDELEFRFEDIGEPFDPDTVAPPDLENPGEGGLGVWLMRQVMDEYIYYREPDGKNVLRLIKRF